MIGDDLWENDIHQGEDGMMYESTVVSRWRERLLLGKVLTLMLTLKMNNALRKTASRLRVYKSNPSIIVNVHGLSDFKHISSTNTDIALQMSEPVFLLRVLLVRRTI